MLGAKPGRSVVSNRRDKIHQTWGTPLAKLYSKLALYELREREGTGRRTDRGKEYCIANGSHSCSFARLLMLDLDRNTLAGCNMELGGEPHNRRMVYCMIESDTATSCCQTDCMVLNHEFMILSQDHHLLWNAREFFLGNSCIVWVSWFLTFERR